jgi:hypothetical protein
LKTSKKSGEKRLIPRSVWVYERDWEMRLRQAFALADPYVTCGSLGARKEKGEHCERGSTIRKSIKRKAG